MPNKPIRMVRTNKPATTDRIYGLDVLADLPYGTVVTDIVGRNWIILSK